MEGLERMRKWVDDLPDQLVTGFEAGSENPYAAQGSEPLVVLGMGGSSIAADLLGSYLLQRGKRALVVCRNFRPPAWVGPETPVLAVSYGGGTVETLAAYDACRSQGARVGVITSGGDLRQRAMNDQAPCTLVPAGLPPRASLGYQLGGLLGMLQKDLSIPGEMVHRTADELRRLRPGIADRGGLSETVAKAWGEGDLLVYVPERLAPVGRRWTTQAEENAKRLAHFDTVPEVLHNAIVAWDAQRGGSMTNRRVVLMHGPTDDGEVARRVTYLAGALRDAGVVTLEIRLQSKDTLTEIMEAVWIGDYASLWHAERSGIDPMPIIGIEKMRKALAKP